MRAFWTWAQPQRFWFRESGLGPRHGQFVISVPLSVPVKSLSHIWLFARLLYPRNSPGKNTGVSAVPSSRGSSWLRDQIHISYVSCFGRQVLYHQRHLWISVYAANLRTIDLNWSEAEKWAHPLAYPSLGFGSYDFERGDLLGHRPNSTLGQKCGTCLIPMKGSLHNFPNIHGRASH